jgi:hypothetical protein
VRNFLILRYTAKLQGKAQGQTLQSNAVDFEMKFEHILGCKSGTEGWSTDKIPDFEHLVILSPYRKVADRVDNFSYCFAATTDMLMTRAPF